MSTDKPVVVYGASGYTGRLIAEYLREFNLPFVNTELAVSQFERVDAAAREIGRDPKEIIRSAALVVAIGRDEAELAKRAEAIGRDVADLKQNGLAGSPAEAVDTIGRWQEETGIRRLYLQVLDLSDLDHIELVAAEVVPQLG